MLSDWESSLTELSSDDDEYVPASKKNFKKAPRKRQQEEYRASGAYSRVLAGITDRARSIGREPVEGVSYNDVHCKKLVWYALGKCACHGG